MDDRFYASLATLYPALINQKHALLQHDNAPAAHTAAALIKAQIKELPGIEFLPHPEYSGPDLALPSDYNLFRSMANFINRGRTFNPLEVLENRCREFLRPNRLLSGIVAQLNN